MTCPAKGSNLRVHDEDRLTAVAAELNDRPRKTLGWDTPAGRPLRLVHAPGVAIAEIAEQGLPVVAADHEGEPVQVTP
ncbi:MAG TPA: hypothetical protein VHN80_08925, partial [Kineosporiaceae bacterium]|nr:hypothetical protein [Kineosporiaceae bacterium]